MKNLLVAAVLGSVVAGALFHVARSRAGTAGRAAVEPAVAAQVDALFAQWNRPGSPGCSAGVSRDGIPIFERGYGMANVEHAVPITAESVFHVASVSKQFTAMSILLLAGRGQLSLDDPVWKYVPEWTDRTDRLTIRHLLNHTGGLRDAFALLSLGPPRDESEDINRAIVRVLARQRSLNFAPGAEFDYSNSGYTLLASIVKRVSGRSLRAFTDANIFKPLGMTHTHVHDDPAILVPNRATGYHADATGVHAALHADLGHLVGTTGVFTTVRDLLIWEQNFSNPRVGDRSIVAAMQAPTVEAPGLSTSGETMYYGYGLEIGRDRGLRTVGHGGGDPGYAAYVVRYPDHELAVAVLCNVDNVGPTVGGLATRLAHLFLGGAAENPPARPTTRPRPVSPGELTSKVGLYRDATRGIYGRILLRDGRLMAVPNAGEEPSVELVPADGNRFLVRGTAVSLEFVPAPDGRTYELKINGEGAKASVLKQVTARFVPTAAELRAYAGTYTSAELDAVYSFSVSGKDLVLQIPGKAPIVVQPIFPDAFHAPLVEVMEFSRDAQQRIIGFEINASGIRHLRFDRAKQ